MKCGVFVFAIACVTVAVSGEAWADTIVFQDDFETGSAKSEWSGITTVEGSQGFAADGFGSSFLRNSTGGAPAPATVLTLTGLPEHEWVTVDFLLAMIDTWNAAPELSGQDYADTLNVEIDGTLLFSEMYQSTEWWTYSPAPGVEIGPAAEKGWWTGQVYTVDRAWRLGADPRFQMIPHSGDSITMRWYAGGRGFTGGQNESWGIDGVTLTVGEFGGSPVPEPTSLALFGLGAAGLGVVRRRRHRA